MSDAIREFYNIDDTNNDDALNLNVDALMSSATDEEIDSLLMGLYDSPFYPKKIKSSKIIDGKEEIVYEDVDFKSLLSVIPRSTKRKVAREVRFFSQKMRSFRGLDDAFYNALSYSSGKYYFSLLESVVNQYKSRRGGVANKSYLKDRIIEEISIGADLADLDSLDKQFGKVYRISMDANGLKSINDNFDHKKGDLYLDMCEEALIEISKKIMLSYGNKIVIELTIEGGDEFGFLIKNKPGEDILNDDIVEKIRATTSSEITRITKGKMSEFNFSSESVIRKLFGDIVFEKYKIDPNSVNERDAEAIKRIEDGEYAMEMHVSCGVTKLSEILEFFREDIPAGKEKLHESVNRKFGDELSKLKQAYKDSGSIVFKDPQYEKIIMGLFLSISDGSMEYYKNRFKDNLSNTANIDDYILYRLYSRNSESIKLINEKVELEAKLAATKKCPECGHVFV